MQWDQDAEAQILVIETKALEPRFDDVQKRWARAHSVGGLERIMSPRDLTSLTARAVRIRRTMSMLTMTVNDAQSELERLANNPLGSRDKLDAYTCIVRALKQTLIDVTACLEPVLCNYDEDRRRRYVALCMATHPRLAVDSSLSLLGADVLHTIARCM